MVWALAAIIGACLAPRLEGKSLLLIHRADRLDVPPPSPPHTHTRTGARVRPTAASKCLRLQKLYDACVAAPKVTRKRGTPGSAQRTSWCQRKHWIWAKKCMTGAPTQVPSQAPTSTSAPTIVPASATNCSAGQFAPENTGPCTDCGVDHYCEGGNQFTPERVECPFGQGTVLVNATSVDDCIVLDCLPCGSATPDVYLTADLSIYKQPAWTEGLGTSTNTAELQCTLDRTDPFLCTTQAAGSCTLNDIAIDNQGDYVLVGRRSSSSSATGWVIRVDEANIVPGEPCPYTKLIDTLAKPWAGLGAAPKSNLFYGLGDGQVFTVEVNATSASILGSISNPAFTGAADVTAGPNGKIYAVVGNNAYQIDVDANYIPTGTTSSVASGGIGSGAGAFCTSTEPYGVRGTTGVVYDFLGASTFSSVGGSGRNGGVNGAAVAPVCGQVPP